MNIVQGIKEVTAFIRSRMDEVKNLSAPNNWIPLKEILPVDNQVVWVSMKEGYVDKMTYKAKSEEFYFDDDPDDWVDQASVIAWMPYKIPEPYKGE